jgi:hypothetical protein
MKELFKNTDADFCSLIEYVKTFIDKDSENYNLFQLPPIQRNAVWNVAQVERLWDSILRGFPFGSFLISSRQKIDKARDIYTGEQNVSAKDGFFLIDGQQRTRSILLGFKSNTNSRLWIDLNPNLTFENAELNDRKFLLRVITSYQPWGMSDRNPSDKLNETQKYNARLELDIKNLHYDYEVKIDNGDRESDDNIFSWPARAELPVPMDELINLCGATTGKYSLPLWKNVCYLIPDRYHRLGKVPETPPDHFKDIAEAIKHIIDTSSNSIRTRTIVLQYQNQKTKENDVDVQDDMEVLFRRVNAGGTALQGEEMAYSLLKSSWDGAYDMVSTIVKSNSIGYLVPATGIVMAATRLSRFIQNINDIPNPGIGNFRKWIGEKEKDGSFLDKIQSLLHTAQEGKSVFYSIVESFCQLTIYRDHTPNDIGLPRKFLLSIKPVLYHPVFIWIYIHINEKEVLEQSRLNILRYLVYCYLTADKYDKVSRIAIGVIKTNDEPGFPDKAIYNALLNEELTVAMPTPIEFENPFKAPADGFLRHWNDLFNILDDPYNEFRQWFWNDSKDLLLWFQRTYVSKWFVGYDPTSDDAYDTPYDWDHIMPKSHLITSGASPETYSDNKDLNKKFDWNRSLYVNSIGNYRLWPFWGNRSDSNQCHTYKFRMEDPKWEADVVAKELGLNSVQDFLNASAVNKDDKELWYNAGGYVRKWPEERRLAWQKAVENRVVYLYSKLYSEFRFEVWKPTT